MEINDDQLSVTSSILVVTSNRQVIKLRNATNKFHYKIMKTQTLLWQCKLKIRLINWSNTFARNNMYFNFMKFSLRCRQNGQIMTLDKKKVKLREQLQQGHDNNTLIYSPINQNDEDALGTRETATGLWAMVQCGPIQYRLHGTSQGDPRAESQINDDGEDCHAERPVNTSSPLSSIRAIQ